MNRRHTLHRNRKKICPKEMDKKLEKELFFEVVYNI